MHLRRTPIGSARLDRTLRGMSGAIADYWIRGGGRIVIGDLARPNRIADVEYANPGIEVAARERGRLVLIINATVVAAVHEAAQSGEVGYHFVAVGGIVHLEHHL